MSSAPSYHKGNLAETLLDAAMTALQTSTAASLSLRSVAKEAGVSHNAPYHHFKDRTALLHAVAVRAMTELVAAQQHASDGASTPIERIIAVGSAYVRYGVENANAFAVIYDPEVCEPGNPLPDMAPLIAANEDLLAQVVRDAVAAGALEVDDTGAAAASLWGMAHGLASLVAMGHLPLAAVPGAIGAFVQPAGPAATPN